MPKIFKYVVVDAPSGGSWPLYGDKDRPENMQPEDCRVLPQLLEQGWLPVRETPLGVTTAGGMVNKNVQAPILVLLEKSD